MFNRTKRKRPPQAATLQTAGLSSQPPFPPKRKGLVKQILSYWEIYLMLIPAAVYFIIFHYLPIYGIQIAFRDFSPVKGIWDSNWAGFKYFERFFQSPYFVTLLKNTLSVSLYQLIAGFFPPIILALLLNHQRSERFKKTVQTASYAPHFISTVVLVGMMKVMLSPSMGIVNFAIEALGGEAIHFFARPEMFRHLYVWSGIWQDLGWSAILYVGALSGISPELYEAATIDGASVWKKIRHIDIPGIMPTIVILLILNSGSILGVGYEKAYLMQNTQNASTSEVISTYVYKQGLVSAQYSYSAAVGLFNSVVNFVFLLIVNTISSRISKTSLF